MAVRLHELGDKRTWTARNIQPHFKSSHRNKLKTAENNKMKYASALLHEGYLLNDLSIFKLYKNLPVYIPIQITSILK